MRVAIGEVVDIHKDLTTANLTIRQKISVIWETMIADSKILGRKKKMEQEKQVQRQNVIYDRLKHGILASLTYHLQENKVLEKVNQEAAEVQLAIDREHEKILERVLESHEFHVYEIRYVEIDPDLVNSFGDSIPVIVAFRPKEVVT